MSEEKEEILAVYEPCCKDKCESDSVKLVRKVSNGGKNKATVEFPWSVLLLGVLRLLFHISPYLEKNSPFIVKADGTTALSRIVRINKFLKYPYVPDKVPVLSIVLTPHSLDATLSILSALSMILAVIVTVLRSEKNVYQKKTNIIRASILIFTMSLLKIAVDLLQSLGSSFTHTHLLLLNVGIPEAVTLLLISITINMVQWYLWYGVLKFQKTLRT